MKDFKFSFLVIIFAFVTNNALSFTVKVTNNFNKDIWFKVERFVWNRCAHDEKDIHNKLYVLQPNKTETFDSLGLAICGVQMGIWLQNKKKTELYIRNVDNKAQDMTIEVTNDGQFKLVPLNK